MKAEEVVALINPLTWLAMLVGRDANASTYGPRNRGRIETAGNPA